MWLHSSLGISHQPHQHDFGLSVNKQLLANVTKLNYWMVNMVNIITDEQQHFNIVVVGMLAF